MKNELLNSRPIFLVCIIFLTFSIAKAQAIDPIQIGIQEPGKFGVHLNLGFAPSGIRFLGPDNTVWTRQSYGIGLSLAVDYTVDERINVSGTAAGAFELARVFSDTQNQILTVANGGGSLSLTYRLDPNSSFDPSLLISFGYPWTLGATLNARLIRDPILLVGLFGVSKPLDVEGMFFNGSVYVSFVANERMTLSSQLSTEIPIGGNALPSSSIAFRIGYTLDSETLEEIGLRVTISIRGDATRVGFGFEWNAPLPQIEEVIGLG
jgi:hypothetical protein